MISRSRWTIQSHSTVLSILACSYFDSEGFGGEFTVISTQLEDFSESERLSIESSPFQNICEAAATLDCYFFAFSSSFAFSLLASYQFFSSLWVFSSLRSSLILVSAPILSMMASQSCSHLLITCWLLSRKVLVERCRASLVLFRAQICLVRLLLVFFRNTTSRCSLVLSWGYLNSSYICRLIASSFSDEGTYEESPRGPSPYELKLCWLRCYPLMVCFLSSLFSRYLGYQYGFTSYSSLSWSPFLLSLVISMALLCRLISKLAFSSSRVETCSINYRFHSYFCANSSLSPCISRQYRFRSPSFMMQIQFYSAHLLKVSLNSFTCSSRTELRYASPYIVFLCCLTNWTMSCATYDKLAWVQRCPPSPSSNMRELDRLALAITSKKANFSSRIISKLCYSSFLAVVAAARSCFSLRSSSYSLAHSSLRIQFSCAISTIICLSLFVLTSSSGYSSTVAVFCPNFSMISVTILTSSACTAWSIQKMRLMLLLLFPPLMAMPSNSSQTSLTFLQTFSPCKCCEISVPISSLQYLPMAYSTCVQDY